MYMYIYIYIYIGTTSGRKPLKTWWGRRKLRKSLKALWKQRLSHPLDLSNKDSAVWLTKRLHDEEEFLT